MLVFRLDLGNGKGGGSLLVDNSSQTALALDNGVRDSHLAAEGREPDNDFNGVNVVGNEDELSLLGLNEGSDVVDTVLDNNGLLASGGLARLGGSFGSGRKTGLLFGLGLRAVLGEKLEGLGSSVLVEGLGELVDRRGNLETLTQDGSLALKTDVFRPLDKAGQVALGLNVASYKNKFNLAFGPFLSHKKKQNQN